MVISPNITLNLVAISCGDCHNAGETEKEAFQKEVLAKLEKQGEPTKEAFQACLSCNYQHPLAIYAIKGHPNYINISVSE